MAASKDERSPIAGNRTKFTPSDDLSALYGMSDELLALLPGAIYFCDSEGVLVRWNRSAVELWGREPKQGDASERFCGSYKLYRADGTFMAHADCPVADALRTGQPQRNIDAIIERPDGARRFVLANIAAIRDHSGGIVGAVNILQDVTDRKHAELSARRSEAWFRRLLQKLPAAAYTCNREGLITSFNSSAVKLWGRSPLLNDTADRFCGSFKLFSKDGTPITHDRCWMALTLQNETAYEGQEIIIERPDGSRRVALAHANPFYDESGKVNGAVNVLVDITEYRGVELALTQSEAQLRLVTDHAPVLMVHCDRDARFKFVNKRYAERLGLTPEDIVGKHIPEVIGVAAYASFQKYVEAALAGQHVEFEVEIPYERIGPRVMHCACAPDVGPQGEVRGLVAVLSDVTQRKQAEDALLESEEHLRAVVETTPACIKVVAADGTLLDMNSAGLAMIEADHLEMIQGKCVYGLIDDEYRDAFRAFNERICRGEKGSLEFEVIGLRGTRRHMETHAAPLRRSDGSLAQLAITHDVTQRKRFEQDLQLQARVLESMSEGVSLADENGIIVYTNPAEDEMFGYERGELVGQHVSVQNTYPPEENQRFVGKIIDQLKTKGAWSGEFSNRRKDGSAFTTHARITSLQMGGRRYFVCVQEDITERKRVEKELQDARSRLDAALNAGAIATWTWDIPNNLLFADKNLASLFNLEPADADGGLLDKYIQSIHPEDWPKVSAALSRSVENGEDYEADYRIMQAGNGVRWVVARGRAERDHNGRAIRMSGVLLDITERKRAEEHLRHSERVSRFLAEATTALTSLSDYETTLQRVAELAVPFFADWCVADTVENGTLRPLTVAHADPEKVRLIEELRRRYPPRSAELHGPFHVLSTGQPELVPEMPDAMLESVAHDEEHLHILRQLKLRSYISVPLVARGRILAVLTFVTAESGRLYGPDDLQLAEDLAHRAALAIDNAVLYKTAQDALRQKEESLALLDTLQRNAPVGFAFVDRQFRYLRINEALAAIDGNVPEYHLGRTVEETVPKLWPRLETLYRSVLETGQAVTNREVTGETPAAPGQIRHWLVSYYPVRVHEEIVGVGVLVADITERKRLENELRQQARQLKEADQRKDEFLATLAHELRNPLAPIRNSLQILKLRRVDAAMAQQTREIMERQLHHLVRLVDDLLDVSRVMRGKIELRKEPVELATIVARAVETSKPLIEIQGHHLEISLPSESLLLFADPVRLAQVIGNLLTNAAKYTEANGRIWLQAWQERDEVVVLVKDNGIGIASDKLPQIFELFVQVDHSSTKAQGGLGIGLTLVKNLIEMHNGKVEARSDGLGKGSEFIVRLPLLVAQPSDGSDAESHEQRQQVPLSGHRLLVVDDNKDAAISLSMLLRLQGHEVQFAYDGETALKLATSFRPDVVFLDIGMPGMDGYDVARQLRQMPGLEKTVLAALTGWGQQDDRRRTAEAGFDHHLVKPPEPKALDQVLAALAFRQ